MEQKTDGKPQNPDDKRGSDDSKLVKDHMALKNQSSVSPQDYPKTQRADQSLTPTKPKRD